MTDYFPRTLPAFLWHFLKRQKWRFAFLFIAPCFIVLESVAMPYAMRKIVDIAAKGPDGEAMMQYALLALGAWSLMIVVFRSQEWVGNIAMPRLQAEMRMRVFDYTLHHSHRYFSNQFAGSLANKINDLPRAAQALFFLFQWNLTMPLSTLSATVVMVWFISPFFSLLIGGWAVFHIGISLYFARRIHHYARANAEDKSILSGMIVDVLANITAVKLFAHHRHEMQRTGEGQEVEKGSNQRTLIEIWKVRALLDGPQILMLGVMFYLLVSGLQEGWISAGAFVFVFFTAVNTLIQVWHMSAELPNFYREIGICQQALDVIKPPHGIVDMPNSNTLEAKHGEIVFENVQFHYIAGKDIFLNKNITIEQGQKVGLVGFSGSGKSTFVNLILRLYEVERGRILIDGQDIRSVTQDSLRETIAVIPQDTPLFHRSLKENIRYGRPEASEEEVIAASKQALCHEFIEALEQGYETPVGERGVKLSGGQRQRIAIARALLKNAPIVILDEATSSLDSVTEQTIQQQFEMLMQGRTTIIIAHRLSTLAHMDRILVFKDGEIIEDGSHEELVRNDRHYTMMWQRQAGGFLPDEAV